MYKIFKINELGKQTIKRLFTIREQIDFYPSYQRFGNIWSIKKQRLLIDTIINGFDIPKFYFNYFVESNLYFNQSNKLYAIIDGKQRLQAIFDFLEDKFALDPDIIYLDNPDLKIGNLKFSDLLNQFPQIVPLIEEYVLDIVFITTDDEDRLEELFLRLNGGVALTNAEKRNAIPSFLNNEIRRLVTEVDFFVNKLRFKNIRYQHNDLLTKLLYIEHDGGLTNLGNKELELFLRLNSFDDNDNRGLIYDTLRVISVMEDIFDDKDYLLNSKGLIPVYYQFIKDNYQRTSVHEIHQFLIEFDKVKLQNRKSDNPNPVLQEFDRLNQQGVHRENSLKSRYFILDNHFESYLKSGSLQNVEIDMEIDDSENFDEF